MPDFDDDLHDPDLHGDLDEPLEAYCVKCRQSVEIEDPEPVWTRKGAPGTRGFCPICGTTIFRMGRTPAHDALKRPGAIKVTESPAQTRPIPLTSSTVCINAAPADADLAHRLADGLSSMGISAYLLDEAERDVHWAGGVHPALQTCARMLVVLSPAALETDAVKTAWTYFREKRKPVVVAQAAPIDVPDALRRAPRVTLDGTEDDTRRALRELVQALAE